MTQSERRLYLIRELLKEQPQYQDIQIPAGRQEELKIPSELVPCCPVCDAPHVHESAIR